MPESWHSPTSDNIKPRASASSNLRHSILLPHTHAMDAEDDKEALLYRSRRRSDYLQSPTSPSAAWWSSSSFRAVSIITALACFLLLASASKSSQFTNSQYSPIAWFRHLKSSSPSSSSSFSPTHASSIQAISRGYSIAAACRNRHSALKQAIPSWLKLRDLDEIIIVDWSSTPPLADTVAQFTSQRAASQRPKLRLIRVDAEPTWMLSRAYNLAFNHSSYTMVAKMDCDYFVSQNLFRYHQLTPSSNVFYTGHYMNARDDNEVHLNGALLVRRDHFFGVGGYDERIQKYGFDDEDLYTRIELRGIERKNLSFDFVSHITHRNSDRAGNGFPRVQIDFNKKMIQACTTKWSNLLRRSEYIKKSGSDSSALVYEASFVPLPIEKWVNATYRREQWRLVLGARLNTGYALPWIMVSSLSTSSMERLLENMMRRESKLDANDSDKDHEMPRMFFVHAQNGLGNRLRALGSAIDFANRTSRELVVIWEKDQHLQAPLSAVLNATRFPYVVMDSAQFRWPLDGWRQYDNAWKQFDLYNYMLDEGKDVKVVNNKSKNIYFKSAFILNNPELSSWETTNAHLRKLPIRDDVMAIQTTLDSYPGAFGGAHIRNRSLIQDITSLKDIEKEYTKEDIAELNKWRALTTVSAFVPEMRRILESNDTAVNKFFVATDSVGVIPTLKRLLGEDKFFYIPRTCDGRSAECIKYAMADILMLSKCQIFLGSTWSSFTEAAMRFGAPKARLAGTDFAIPAS